MNLGILVVQIRANIYVKNITVRYWKMSDVSISVQLSDMFYVIFLLSYTIRDKCKSFFTIHKNVYLLTISYPDTKTDTNIEIESVSYQTHSIDKFEILQFLNEKLICDKQIQWLLLSDNLK